MISHLAKELGQGDSCAYLLLGFFRATEPPPNSTITWLLCMLAELGTSRNSHGLLKHTLSLAASFNIAVSDVVGAMRATGAPIRPSEDGPPKGLAVLLDSLAGFVFARGARPSSDGTVKLYTNRAFREGLCTPDVVRSLWGPNELPLLSKFVHKEDLCASRLL